MKFHKLKQIMMVVNSCDKNNSRWRTDAILQNVVFGHNSAVYCQIFAKKLWWHKIWQ